MADIYERLGATEGAFADLQGRVTALERGSLRSGISSARAQLEEIQADAANLRALLDSLQTRVTDSLPALDKALADVSDLIRAALDDDLGALEGLDTLPPPSAPDGEASDDGPDAS